MLKGRRSLLGDRRVAGGWDPCGPWRPPLLSRLDARGPLGCPRLPCSASALRSLISHFSLSAYKEDISQHQRHRGERGGEEQRKREAKGAGGRQRAKEKDKEGTGRQPLAPRPGLRSLCALSTWHTSLNPVLPQARVDV